MSRFFVCHEPQCTEVVLNPYRHHLDMHSQDLTDEAILCLRQQASKQEVKILKETKKFAAPCGRKNIKQPVSKLQIEKPKSRKFGENSIGNVGKKKKTLDIPSSNISTTNLTENIAEVNNVIGTSVLQKTVNEEKDILCLRQQALKHEVKSLKETKKSAAPGGRKNTKQPVSNLLIGKPKSRKFGENSIGNVGKRKQTLDIPSSNISTANSTENIAKAHNVIGTSVFQKIVNEKKDKSLNPAESARYIHRTVTKPRLPGASSGKNARDANREQIKISSDTSCDLSSPQLKRKKCEIIDDSVQQTSRNIFKKSSLSIKQKVLHSTNHLLSKSSTSKLCNIDHVTSKNVDLKTAKKSTEKINLIEDLANSSDQRSLSFTGSERRLESLQLDPKNMVSNLKKENLPLESADWCNASKTKYVPSSDSTISIKKTEKQGIDDGCMPSLSDNIDIIELDPDNTALIKNGKTKNGPSSPVDHSHQNEVKVEFTHSVGSKVVSLSGGNVPIPFTSTDLVEKKVLPPGIHTTPQFSPISTAQSCRSPTVFQTPGLPYYSTPSVADCQDLTPVSPVNSVPPTTPAMYCGPLSSPSSHTAHNLRVNSHHQNILPRDCIPSTSAKMHHQRIIPFYRNTFSFIPNFRNKQGSPGICGSPNTVLRGQLHSYTKNNLQDKLNQQCESENSKTSDVSSKLNETSLPCSPREKPCLDVSSPSSATTSELSAKQPDNWNTTKSIPSHCSVQTNGENYIKSTVYLSPNNQLELKSISSNEQISSEKTSPFQESTALTASPAHSRKGSGNVCPRPNHLNYTILHSNKLSVPGQTIENSSDHSSSCPDMSQKCNPADSTLIEKSDQKISMPNDAPTDVSSLNSMLADEPPVSLSQDEIMYRVLVSQYAIRHLSNCIDSPKNGVTTSYKEAENVQSVLMLLLFLKSHGDTALLCHLTVFDVLGAQNLKGDYQIWQQSTGKTVMLSSSEQNYLKNFIKNVRPILSQDSYGCLFTTNRIPFSETTFRQPLRYCWIKAQVGFDVSVLWRHVKRTSADSESACDNKSQNSSISSTSEIAGPSVVDVPCRDGPNGHCTLLTL